MKRRTIIPGYPSRIARLPLTADNSKKRGAPTRSAATDPPARPPLEAGTGRARRYTGQTAGSAGIALSRTTWAMKWALAFGIRCWVAKSTNTIPNRFW
jgi:hypothetical protein